MRHFAITLVTTFLITAGHAGQISSHVPLVFGSGMTLLEQTPATTVAAGDLALVEFTSHTPAPGEYFVLAAAFTDAGANLRDVLSYSTQQITFDTLLTTTEDAITIGIYGGTAPDPIGDAGITLRLYSSGDIVAIGFIFGNGTTTVADHADGVSTGTTIAAGSLTPTDPKNVLFAITRFAGNYFSSGPTGGFTRGNHGHVGTMFLETAYKLNALTGAEPTWSLSTSAKWQTNYVILQ